MADSKVNRENYIVVQGFMVTDLHLKGNELLVYAIIYGFSQAESQVFNGGLQYLADWTNSTKQGVLKCLKSLTEKGYIVKTDKIINGVKFCEYRSTELNTVLNKVEYPNKQSLKGGIEQSLNNNIPHNTILDNKNNIISEFEELWSLYPNKKGKDKAQQYYIKARKSGVEFETVKNGILAYAKECKLKKREKQYIKHGSTWFNSGGWNDEYDLAETEQNAGVESNGKTVNNLKIGEYF